jgi:hypothetical protein
MNDALVYKQQHKQANYLGTIWSLKIRTERYFCETCRDETAEY